MNVPRRLLGKVVELTWCDPNYQREELVELKRGRSALITWREYGTIYDLTDGVVIIAHSLAGDPVDEIARTAVPESLIETLTVLEPVREGV